MSSSVAADNPFESGDSSSEVYKDKKEDSAGYDNAKSEEMSKEEGELSVTSDGGGAGGGAAEVVGIENIVESEEDEKFAIELEGTGGSAIMLGFLCYLPITPFWPIIVGTIVGCTSSHPYAKVSGYQAALLGLTWMCLVIVAPLGSVAVPIIIALIWVVGTIIIVFVDVLLSFVSNVIGAFFSLIITVVWVVIIVIIGVVGAAIIGALWFMLLIGGPVVLLAFGLVNAIAAPKTFTLPPWGTIAKRLAMGRKSGGEDVVVVVGSV